MHSVHNESNTIQFCYVRKVRKVLIYQCLRILYDINYNIHTKMAKNGRFLMYKICINFELRILNLLMNTLKYMSENSALGVFSSVCAVNARPGKTAINKLTNV
jgi:hypothetical protein